MNEDIHKWTDGRYTLMFDEHTFFVWDNEKDERMTALQLTKKLNEQQSTIDKLEQRDYYNQSERYKILGRAIELTINYIANSDEEHYDIGALITEFEKELLDESY